MTHFNVIIGLKRFYFVSYKNIIWHEEKCDIQKNLLFMYEQIQPLAF